MLSRSRGLPLLIMVVLALSGCTATALPDATPPGDGVTTSEPDVQIAGQTAAEFTELLVRATNVARAEAGLSELDLSECALPFAARRAEDLIGAPALEHASLHDLSQACALSGQITGENLIRGIGTPSEFTEAWLNSPGHRANLLNPNFLAGAISCVIDHNEAGEPQWLCSHLFVG